MSDYLIEISYICIKSGRLPNNTVFNLDNVEIEIVKNFTYLGIVFSTGGSFSEAQSALSGQALKASNE